MRIPRTPVVALVAVATAACADPRRPGACASIGRVPDGERDHEHEMHGPTLQVR